MAVCGAPVDILADAHDSSFAAASPLAARETDAAQVCVVDAATAACAVKLPVHASAKRGVVRVFLCWLASAVPRQANVARSKARFKACSIRHLRAHKLLSRGRLQFIASRAGFYV